MPKHRSTLYAVVREHGWHDYWGDQQWAFGAVVGIYTTLIRAEEVAGSSLQALKDINEMAPAGFRFKVVPTTFYDE